MADLLAADRMLPDRRVPDKALPPDKGPVFARPKTPEIVGIFPMAANFHVAWTLNDVALSAVELWRKKDTGAWSKAYTLAGTMDNVHDSGAKAPGTFCYRVTTYRGALASDPSAEKCRSF